MRLLHVDRGAHNAMAHAKTDKTCSKVDGGDDDDNDAAAAATSAAGRAFVACSHDRVEMREFIYAAAPM